jgi:uncharacterized membrane protein
VADLNDLTVRVHVLEDRLRAVEAELRLMRGEPAQAAPAPVPPAPMPAAPMREAPPVPAARRYVTAATAPPPAAPPPASRPPRRNVLLEGLPEFKLPSVRGKLPNGELPSVTFADLVGARALAWVGGLVTLLGIVFFFVLAVNRGWVSAELRVCLGAIVSVGLYALAWFVRRRYGSLDAALAAAGAAIGGAYATLVAASVLYDFVPQGAALAAATGIAAVGVATALVWNAQLTAILGLAGAMLAPPLIENGDPSAAGAIYVAVLLAAAVGIAVHRSWHATLAAAGALSLAEVLVLFAERDTGDATSFAFAAALFCLLYLAAAVAVELTETTSPLPTLFSLASFAVAAGLVAQLDETSPTGPLVVLGMVWVAYLGAGIGAQLVRNAARLSRFAASIVLASVSLAFWAVHVSWGDGREAGFALLVVAGATAAPLVPLLLYRRGQRDLATLLWAAALSVLAVSLGELLGGQQLTLAWSAQGALVGLVALRTRESRLYLAGAAYLVLAIGHLLPYEAPPEDLFHALANPSDALFPIAYATAGTALFALALRRGRPTFERVLGVTLPSAETWVLGTALTASALALYWASWVVLSIGQLWSASVRSGFEPAEAGVTALWGAVALALVVLGILRRRDPVVFAGVGLFGAAVLKLVAFDLAELSRTNAAWAAFALGMLALAMGYAFLLDRRESLCVAVLMGSAVLAAPAVVELLGGKTAGIDADGGGLVLLGVLYGLLAARHVGDLARRDTTGVLWAIGELLVGVGLAFILHGEWLVLGWAVLGAGIAYAGRTTGEKLFFLGSATAVGSALLYALAVEAPLDTLFTESAHPASGVPALVFAGLGVLVLTLCLRDEAHRRIGAWTTGAVALYAGSLTILGAFQQLGGSVATEFQRGHTATSAMWVLVGLALLAFGLRSDRRLARLAGLALFALALAKIFLYDLANLSSLARAGSFLAVGSVLLVAAFLYQRLTEDRDEAPVG